MKDDQNLEGRSTKLSNASHESPRPAREQRIWRMAEVKPPVTLEWPDPDIVRTVRINVVAKRGYNLLDDDGRWFWWPTIKWYGVRISEQQEPPGVSAGCSLLIEKKESRK